jgi:uncharacterized RDD family membrane protein YckC
MPARVLPDPPAPADLTLETPERVAITLEPAGLGPRAFAFLADLVLLFLAWVIALVAYSISGDLLREWQALSALGQLAAMAAVLLLGWGWDVAWETLGAGRTPGKRLLGLRVVRADGGPVGLGESLVRNLLRAVELPLGYAPGVLAVALSPRRQRLGDLAAGTLVVRERRYDLSRYAADAPPDPRFAALAGRAGRALGPGDLDRLQDFLARRPALLPAARARLASRLAAALSVRAGVAPPGDGDAEPFLEALARHAAEGR